MILYGVRSPLVVDYENTAARSGIQIRYGVSAGGHPRLMGEAEVLERGALGDAPRFPAMPCAFSPKRREELAEAALADGFALHPALVDPSAVLPPRIRIGDASFVNALVAVGGGSVFGTGVLVNRSASIGHHCVLEDYVSIGPGAILSGNVRVGRGAVIGAGAIIQSHVRIGAGALISAGSLVRKPVPDGALIAGNPAKQMPFRPGRSSLDGYGDE